MTTGATRKSRRTFLRVTELERRDTPAWWAIAAPAVPGGTHGSTDATITGELSQSPDYPVTNGFVSVWADDAVHAAGLGLAGTMYSKYADHDLSHAFIQQNIGYDFSDHTPFVIVPSGGGGVDILYEDSAGDSGADYDYNDQTWKGIPVPPTTNPVLFEGDFLWTGSSGDAKVHERVEALSPTVYKWDYFVHNISFQSSFSVGLGVGASGMGRVHLPSLSKEFVLDSYSSRGGQTFFSQETGPGVGEVMFLFGNSPQESLRPGQDAEFWLTTAPQPLETRSGSGKDYMVMWSTSGPVVGPGTNEVRVEITDRTGTPIGAVGAQTLKVAKWANAFDFVPKLDARGKQYPDPVDPLRTAGTAKLKGVDPVTGLDIIDGDDDRFNVWVYDKARWDAKTPHIKAKISTDNVVGFTEYNDLASDIDLVRSTDGTRPPGWFWSDSQMLVSNAMDDTAAIPGVGGDENNLWGLGAAKGGYAWHKADRTHRVALRGTVKAEYAPDAGPVVSDSKAVPTQHIIQAVVYIFNDANAAGVQIDKGVVAQTDVVADFKRANEQYAQVGIQFTHDLATRSAWHGAIALGDGMREYGNPVNGKLVLAPEDKDILSTGAKLSDVGKLKVYYINYFDSGFGRSLRRGEAVIAKQSPFDYFADSVVVASESRVDSPFTLAHEIGHVLLNVTTNGGHEYIGTWPVNLMRAGTSSSDAIDSSKRLTKGQDELMNTERKNLWG